MGQKRSESPGLSRLVEETISTLSPIQSIMKIADPSNIVRMGLDPENIISFGGGWCNHEAPERLREIYADICLDASDFHISGRYSAITGNLKIREQLCEFEKNIFSVNGLRPDNICVGHSSTQLFHDVLRVICDPGDGIAVLDPSYVNYFNAVKCALPGSSVQFIPALDPVTWEYMPDPEIPTEYLKELCSEGRIKALVIPDPDNPTSQIMPSGILSGFLDILTDAGAYLVMDHAYKTQYFGDMPETYSWSCEDIPNLISIHSNSKWLSSLGRRLGWLEAPSVITNAMERLVESTLLSPDSLHSAATARFLEESIGNGSLVHYIDEMRKLYQRTATITMKAIDRHMGKPRLDPKGGLYTCVKIDTDPVRFTEEILRETGVLFIPGTGFGPSMEEGIRVSYGPLCDNHDKIVEGMERVGSYI
ncbi:MAG: pyridoxal phosphate-dependent aminotransferase [Candidatus Thermoplasmatota archaeon]|jgi:aminotransferase|nr:pyridoxal phosphate-dependent aminotransferase [Candidatus Thermoplasmatota archaeon]MDP7265518.1 pyridoxal phosphate-dependent aminotransferase [Candidatus Thermoplasmatota archaeon]